jgi:hypothetical protein
MFQSFNVKATGDDFSVEVACGHTSSRSPFTCLFNLCDRSHLLQARRASCLTESSGTRASGTWVLISAPPNLVKEKRMRQLGPWDTLIVASRWLKKVCRISSPVNPLCSNP